MRKFRSINRAEVILLVGSNIWYLAEGMLGPIFAVFTERVGGDVLDISVAWAVFLIVSGLLSVYVGKIAVTPRITKTIMIFGYALNAIFTFGYLFVNDATSLLAVQAGLGIASALATPTWDALYARESAKIATGYSWGLADGTPQIVQGIAIVLGGLIVTLVSFNALFLIMGSIQVLATLYQAQILLCKST